MPNKDVLDEGIIEKIHELVRLCGGSIGTYETDLVTQQIQNSLKLMSEGHTLGQLKLMTRSLKEMRYAYRVFNDHPGKKRISIFGSARTPEDHPDYITARAFSEKMARENWMCITGAANGIMKAGLEGQKPEGKFGLSILLPFESQTNMFSEGDPKLIFFRYFFTRKLMFMSHSDAVAVFPGGYGTLDELFESLTLMQTGKGNLVPVVMLEGAGGTYWHHWKEYVDNNLLKNGWISKDDQNLYHIAKTVEDGVQHIVKFYHRYHSNRYVEDKMVIRLSKPLTENQVAELNEKFALLMESGEISYTNALPEENEFMDLPRLVFHHNRRHLGVLRAMIDAINNY